MTTDQAKPTRGLCAQCGLEVEIDVPPDGHTRAAHDSPSTHDEQGNCRTCPIPVLCGPVIVDDMSEAKPTELLQSSQLRRWCDYGQTHQDADDPVCGWQDCGAPAIARRGHHRLRLRRMFICSKPDCQQGYFTKKELDRHECYSAY